MVTRSEYKTGDLIAYAPMHEKSAREQIHEDNRLGRTTMAWGRWQGYGPEYPGRRVFRVAEEAFADLLERRTNSDSVWQLRLELPWSSATYRLDERVTLGGIEYQPGDYLLHSVEIAEQVWPMRLGVVVAETDRKRAVEVYPLADDQGSAEEMPIVAAMEACHDVGVRLDVETYTVGTPEWLAWWRTRAEI